MGAPSPAASPHPPWQLDSALCQRTALLPGISHPPALFLHVQLYFNIYFFKQILAIYLNNWFSSCRTHRVVGDREREPREACGGPGVYVYPPVALCLIPATGSD